MWLSAIMTERKQQDQDKFIVRLPEGMRDRIKAAADRNNRSMNAEIVATLEEKYPRLAEGQIPDQLIELIVEMSSISARLQTGLGKSEEATLRRRYKMLNEEMATFFDVPPELAHD